MAKSKMTALFSKKSELRNVVQNTLQKTSVKTLLCKLNAYLELAVIKNEVVDRSSTTKYVDKPVEG